MKRNDDGYVLPLVLVVLTVLALVASSVLSASLRNLQVQHKSIERTQAKYVAEGAVEIAIATLEKVENYDETWDIEESKEESGNTTGSGTTDKTEEDNTNTGESNKADEAEANADEIKGYILSKVQAVNTVNLTVSLGQWVPQSDEKVFVYQFPIKASCDSVEIESIIKLTIKIDEAEKDAKKFFEIVSAECDYISYQIGGAGA